MGQTDMTALDKSIRRSLGYGDVVRKKKKPSAMKKAVAYADSWFRKYIKLRDKLCVTCGAPTTDCSHIFKGRHHNTRWNKDCAYGQCHRCHLIHHLHSEKPLLDYWHRHIGMPQANSYWVINNQVSKLTAADIGSIGDSYRDMCKEMK